MAAQTAMELGFWSARLNTKAMKDAGHIASLTASSLANKNNDASFLELYLAACAEISVVPHPQIVSGGQDVPAKDEENVPMPLRQLRVFGWSLDLGSAMALSLVLPSCLHLTTLRLWNAGLTPEVVTVIGKTLPTSSVTRLMIDWNPFEDEDSGVALAQLVGRQSPLKVLSLRGNRIRDACLKPVVEALEQGSALTSLNLGSNELTDASAQAFAAILRHNRTLASLSLAHNRITEVGLIALLEVLKTFPLDVNEAKEKNRFQPLGPKLENGMASCLGNNMLKSLVLSYNDIADDGAEAAVEALHENKMLARLSITHNMFSSKILKRLEGHSRIISDRVPSDEDESSICQHDDEREVNR